MNIEGNVLVMYWMWKLIKIIIFSFKLINEILVIIIVYYNK